MISSFVCIPAGTCIVEISLKPSIFTFVPSAASHGVRYNLVLISCPFNLKFSSFCILTVMNKSPFFPPFFPIFPSPGIFIFCPFEIPSGIFTIIVLSFPSKSFKTIFFSAPIKASSIEISIFVSMFSPFTAYFFIFILFFICSSTELPNSI